MWTCEAYKAKIWGEHGFKIISLASHTYANIKLQCVCIWCMWDEALKPTQFVIVVVPHYITQLLGCVLWDHVLHKHNSPFILAFYVHEEHLNYLLWTFWQPIIIYFKFLIATFFFRKKPSYSCLIILCNNWCRFEDLIASTIIIQRCTCAL